MLALPSHPRPFSIGRRASGEPGHIATYAIR